MKLIFKLLTMKEEIRIPFQLDICYFLALKILMGIKNSKTFKKNCKETCLPEICVKELALKDIFFNYGGRKG